MTTKELKTATIGSTIGFKSKGWERRVATITAIEPIREDGAARIIFECYGQPGATMSDKVILIRNA